MRTAWAFTTSAILCSDVRELTGIDFAPLDYIIAHGLYPWVPEDAWLRSLPSVGTRLRPQRARVPFL